MMKLQLLHALLLLQLVNFSAAFPAQLPRRTNKHTPTNIAATSHDNNCHAARREGLLSSDVIVEIPTSTATRRKALMRIFGGIVAMSTAAASNGNVANAAADCFQDCLKNCRLIAPKDTEYCTSNCQEYCDQPDRTDGLSGSVSAENGEFGLLGGSFGTGTVVKGEDKPPSVSLPGLDFTSKAGKKLIGY